MTPRFSLPARAPMLLLSLLAVVLLPLAALAAGKPRLPAGPAPVAGSDYIEIDGGQPYAPAKGKIEVVEVFGYTCPACARFEPLVAAWKARQPADVKFVPLAAPFGGMWTPYAKAFYTADSLGLVGKSHAAMFRALHEEGSLPKSQPSVDEIAGFYARFGADPGRFANAFASAAIAARLQQADQFIRRSGVEHTPTLVVAGKYRVTGASPADNLRIAEHLVARERAAKRR
ncbi:thiol:disulfide interchange protein DsbA/DsbL [Lysobacter koreensis]|uniref:Thiol:disulfide interchange protein DsbA n=1 Tax=Lysobacter koreensis TaxID=266122 RepID=A0ABW2YQY6_9GAMM